MSVLRQFVDALRAVPREIEQQMADFAAHLEYSRTLPGQAGLTVDEHQYVVQVMALSNCSEEEAVRAVVQTLSCDRDPQELVDVLTAESADPLVVADVWMQEDSTRGKEPGQ